MWSLGSSLGTHCETLHRRLPPSPDFNLDVINSIGRVPRTWSSLTWLWGRKGQSGSKKRVPLSKPLSVTSHPQEGDRTITGRGTVCRWVSTFSQTSPLTGNDPLTFGFYLRFEGFVDLPRDGDPVPLRLYLDFLIKSVTTLLPQPILSNMGRKKP